MAFVTARFGRALALAKARKTYPTGLCLQFVRLMYGVAARYPSATAAWNATRYRHTSTPPKGVPVWWTGGSKGFGHVAISDGGGYVISTDYPTRGRVGRVRISTLTSSWRLRYRGWSEDINGVRVYRAAVKQAKFKPPAFPKGIGPNRRRPSAMKLQLALQRAGHMPKSVKRDPNYGPHTQRAVAKFHDSKAGRKFKSKRLRLLGRKDVRIGPKGWKYLMTKTRTS